MYSVGPRKLSLLAAAAAAAIPAFAMAQTNASWNINADGSWSVPTNWNPATPPGGNGVATFGAVAGMAAPITVTVNTNVSLEQIRFTGTTPATGYTLAPGIGIGSITMVGAGTLDPAATIEVATGGISTISTQLVTTAGNLFKVGGGTLVLSGNNSFAGGLSINEGTVRATTASAINGVSLIATAGGGVFELNNTGNLPNAFLGLGASGAPGGTIRSVGGDNTWNGAWFIVQQGSVGVDSGTFTLNGSIFDSNDPAFNGLTKSGVGLFQVDNLRLFGGLTVNGGTVRVEQNGTSAGVSKVSGLTLAGGATPSATLDVTDNDFIVDYTGASPIDTVRQQIRSAYNGGAWDGQGITTSLGGEITSGNPALIGKTAALGYAEATAIGSPTVFNGQSIDATSLIIKYTVAGDSDLDGDVDGIDVGLWAQNFTGELGGAGSSVWSQGDWDYDGDVDGVDVGLWAQNFTGELGGAGLSSVTVVGDINPQAVAILAGMGITIVPEPATLSVVSLAFAAICGHRRNRGNRKR